MGGWWAWPGDGTWALTEVWSVERMKGISIEILPDLITSLPVAFPFSIMSCWKLDKRSAMYFRKLKQELLNPLFLFWLMIANGTFEQLFGLLSKLDFGIK